MFEQPREVRFTLPGWLLSYAGTHETTTDRKQRMRFVIEAARQNVLRDGGAPFAAAVYEMESGRLVSLGVNRVTAQDCSLLHAEMVAIALAQRQRETFDLAAPGQPPFELYTSTEPCAMCYGAIPWSGLRRIVCAAREEDAREIGFDEGPKPEDWIGGLQKRGIEVVTGVEREAARKVLQLYVESGGVVYNGGRKQSP